jgi:hypothetical protein
MGIKVQCAVMEEDACQPKLNVIDTKAVFNAVDGLHHAQLVKMK